jgi:predicted NodU family carbamoyl transferase
MITTTTLGVSAFYHDSAAALVRDGVVLAAAQEERFTRKKHDPGFPEHAVAYCQKEAGLKPRSAQLRRVLRQADAEIRAPSKLCGMRTERRNESTETTWYAFL